MRIWKLLKKTKTLGFLNDPSTIVIGTKKFLQNSSSWSELFQLRDVEYSDVLWKSNKDVISKDRHQDCSINQSINITREAFIYVSFPKHDEFIYLIFQPHFDQPYRIVHRIST